MPVLSSSNGRLLLSLARETILTQLVTGDHLRHETRDPELLAPRGVFVTLRKAGHLRGCVGTFESSTPLVENVIRMASAAALRDSRFPPVTKAELTELRIEISVLGALEKVEQLEDIQIGRHGVYIKYENRSGTFLPDVAVEQKWDVPTFVMTCAREKAGLSPKECAGAGIFRYEVEKFSEK